MAPSPRDDTEDVIDDIEDALNAPINWISGIFKVFAGLSVVSLIFWIIGLVKLSKCDNSTSLFVMTLLFYFLLPFVGQIWGFVIGVLALVKLRKPGDRLLGAVVPGVPIPVASVVSNTVASGFPS